MHEMYNQLDMNFGYSIKSTLGKNGFLQTGLQLYSDREAYGAQFIHFGGDYGSKLSSIDNLYYRVLYKGEANLLKGVIIQ